MLKLFVACLEPFKIFLGEEGDQTYTDVTDDKWLTKLMF